MLALICATSPPSIIAPSFAGSSALSWPSVTHFFEKRHFLLLLLRTVFLHDKFCATCLRSKSTNRHPSLSGTEDKLGSSSATDVVCSCVSHAVTDDSIQNVLKTSWDPAPPPICKLESSSATDVMNVCVSRSVSHRSVKHMMRTSWNPRPLSPQRTEDFFDQLYDGGVGAMC